MYIFHTICQTFRLYIWRKWTNIGGPSDRTVCISINAAKIIMLLLGCWLQTKLIKTTLALATCEVFVFRLINYMP